MPKLVIQSSRSLNIGESYRDVFDPIAVHRPEQIVHVVAESTREEWVECLVSFGEDRDWAEALSVLDPYFYEILTD